MKYFKEILSTFFGEIEILVGRYVNGKNVLNSILYLEAEELKMEDKYKDNWDCVIFEHRKSINMGQVSDEKSSLQLFPHPL